MFTMFMLGRAYALGTACPLASLPRVQTESSEMSMRHLTLMLPLAAALQLGGRGWTAPRVRAVASAPAAEAELLTLLEASGQADRGKALSADPYP